MNHILLQNGIIVSGGEKYKSDILIEDNRIVRVEPEIKFGSLLHRAQTTLINAEGCYVFPGFIDAHTHLDMQAGAVHTADDFQSGTRAALAGGTTSVIDFATQNKGDTLNEALCNWHALADNKSSCNYGFHMAITDWQPATTKQGEKNFARNADTLSQLKDIAKKGISSIKVYMAYDALKLNDAQILEILIAAKELGILVGCHCENGEIVNYLTEKKINEQCKLPREHPASRPPPVEAEAVSRFLALAQIVQVPVHIVHLSAKQSLEVIRLARKQGQKFFTETCPQYLTLTDKYYQKGHFEGAKYVCSPPLRKKQDQHALWKEIARHSPQKDLCAKDNSLIQTISTDHCSFNFKNDKELGKNDFSKIPNGLPGVQHRAQLIFTGGNVGKDSESVAKNEPHLDVTQFSALMSENAAKIFGLYPERGVIAPGAIADITVWDPLHTETITVETCLQNVDYTPYEGFDVQGRAKYVILNGKVCATEGRIIQEGKGTYLFRKTGFSEE